MDQIDFSNEIAIIGMSGRFPGARSIHEFWQNLQDGRESISFFTDQELAASGVKPAVYNQQQYVKAGAVLDGVDMFDAAFFGITPRDAALMDPQQRLFLECAWEALEQAGYDAERYAERIGIYAGASMDTYLLSNLASNRELIEKEGLFQIGLGNERDYLATRVSYKLNLRGPSISVSSACSTSLVAVHLAVQSLLNSECDMALAGGVSVRVPHKIGYVYQEGGIVSPDGHCRAFDEQAQGTLRGNGVGVVLLKRLADALQDGDTIFAVIKGSAINNDGSAKIGYTAPGTQGQAQVIAEAQAIAGIEPEMVTYVEAHGTGTALGDPIEIAALTRAFRTGTKKNNFCAIGSVKTNVGHLDAAAGITGLIKTVLALVHKQLPPSLHFVRPNPRIDFANSPFYVNTQLTEWKSEGFPRTAGVSSFGIGGTNAHVVLQEAPPVTVPAREAKPWQLLLLSARTETALATMSANLARHLAQQPELPLADVAAVLQLGRKQFDIRRAVVCHNSEEAIRALEMLDHQHVATGEKSALQRPVTFLFPGQGSQHIQMAAELYQYEPVFRKYVDMCAHSFQPYLKADLRKICYPASEEAAEATQKLTRTAIAQPALFTIEYALAQLWMAWGIQPQALIGHSIGEYVAACLAGVFSLEDAIRLVALRGKMMQALPAGDMLAVSLPPDALQPFLNEQLSLAAINTPARCVLSGTKEAVRAVEEALEIPSDNAVSQLATAQSLGKEVLVEKGVMTRRLHTSHAFHSSMMDPILAAFTAEVKKVQLKAPVLPFVSNVTGAWITAAEATDPAYWARHLRQTVQFAAGLQLLMEDPQCVLLEVGPGAALCTLAKQHSARKKEQRVLSSLPHAQKEASDFAHVLQTLGQLWIAGVRVDWTSFAGDSWQRVPLPTYPFERQRHWIEAPDVKHQQEVIYQSNDSQDALPRQKFHLSIEGKTKEMAVSNSHMPTETRQKEIMTRLKDIFGHLLGTDLTAVDQQSSFLEIGADSLLLMQASQRIKDVFSIKIPFRHLLENYDTFDSLAAYLDQKLPSDFIKEPPAEQRGFVGTQFIVSNGVVARNNSEPLPMEAPVQAQREPNTQKLTAPLQRPSAPLMPANGYVGNAANGHMVQSGSSTRIESIVEQQLQLMAQMVEQQRLLMSQQLEALGTRTFVNDLPSTRVQETLVAAPLQEQTVIASFNGVASQQEVLPAPVSINDTLSQQPTATLHPMVGENGPVLSLRMDPETYVPYQPRKTGALGGLTEQQQQYIAALIERVARKTKGSKQIAQDYRKFHADNRGTAGFNLTFKEVVYPLAVERAEGAHVWDVDGNEYVDIAMGFGALLFGHSPSFLVDALQEQARRGIGLGWQSYMVGKVAKLFCEITGVERVSFCNSGTEAVMTAIRLARATTGRSKIAVFAGSFHGTFDGVLVKSHETADKSLRTIALAPGTPDSMIEDVISLYFGRPESLEMLKAHAQDLAAVIVELPQSRRPDLLPTKFLQELRKFTTEAGVALIFDEVVAGFRMHLGGAQALFGVRADIVTYGKAFGGGLPVAAIGGKAEFMDAVDGGVWQYGDASIPDAMQTFFAGTYFKHPLLMPVVWSILNHLKSSGPQLQEQLNQRTTQLMQRLDRLFEQMHAPIRTIHFGSLFRFLFPPAYKVVDANLFFYHLLEKGIYIAETRNCFLSTAHTASDLDYIVQAIQETLVELQAGGFLIDTSPWPDPSDPGGGTGPLFLSRTLSQGSVAITRLASPLSSVFANDGHNQEAHDAVRMVPMSEQQKELWFMAQFGTDASRAYHESLTMHLRGSFQADAMRQAVQALIQRHESLRTTFSSEGDYQRILPSFDLDIAWSDFSSLAEEVQERQVADVQAREIQKPFDLEHGPLMRIHLVKLQEQHHLFVFTVHHIIADGRSVGTMLAELSVLYTNACSGTQAHLPAATQYREFVEWLEQPEQQELMTSAQAYWLSQFTSLPPILTLPTDFPRPARKTFKGAFYVTKIDAKLCNELKNLSRQQHCTLFTTLLAAYTALLSRLTNQTDLVVSVSAAGHTLIDNEHLVGHCVNLLPLRLKIEDDPTLARYLQAVKTVLLNSYEHQIYPLSKLVEKLNLPRDPSSMPLVTTSFNLDRAGELAFADLEADIITNSTGFAKFDFDLNIVQTDTELVLECNYNADLFRTQTIQRWMGYLKTLLQGMTQAAALHFSELPLMSQEEEQQLLFEWNNTHVDYPVTGCIHQLFEQQAQRTPDRVAVSCAGQQLRYRELNERANQLAHYLQRLGVGPDVLVGICMERSLDMVIGLLGILKAGGAYMPMDPTYPQDRLAFMLSNAHAPVLLTLQHLREQVPAYQGQIVCLDSDWQTLSQEAQTAPACSVTADNLAYVIYTSGSTGQPKGAMVAQRGMLNHLFAKIQTLDLTSDDTVAQTASHCFDISVWQFFAALLQGGQVCIYPNEIARDPVQLFRHVAAERVSILEIVPSLLQAYLDAIELLSEQASVEASLRWLVVTGEQFPAPLAARWLRHFPQVTLLNAYGPTECSDDVTHAVLHQALLERGATAPIGLPVGNTQIYILDRVLQPLPVGVPGEIYVGGIGVGRGYVGDAARTASTFIPDPFGVSGGRLYKTGDVGRYHPDGQIEFIQRVDHQVKVRGYRIELGEIEAVLGQHPAVRQCLVLVREDEPGQQRLVAYLTAVPGEKPAANQLYAWLHDKLPVYMIPVAFVLLEEFPLSANGKLERAALPAPERDHSELTASYIAPRTDTEELLADIWCEVLALERVGVLDNFFAIGGHSLPATQVMARLRKRIQVDLPLQALFEHPTIAGLAEQIEQAQHKPGSVAALALPDIRPRRALFPLSFAQRRLWFLSQLEPESPFYNIPVALHMQGPLQREALERTLSEIVQRHEILRTIIVLADGQPMQQVLPAGDIRFSASDLTLTDLSHLPSSEQQERVQQSVQAEAMKPFELNKGPLLRGQLLRLSSMEHVLLLTMHHIIFDGWSHDILMRELGALYEAFSRGKSSPLSALPLQYADYALWQREWLQNDVLAEQVAYWRKRLAGVPTVLNLPTDRPRPPAQTFRGAVVRFSVAPSLSAALKELSRQEGATLFMTLLAAFGVLLSRYSGQSDVLVGSPVANRRHVEFENLIGLFVNTLVLHTNLSGNPSFRALLGRVNKTTLEAYQHQDLSFEKLVDELQLTRDVSYSPLFQVLFVLQNMSAPTEGFADLTLRTLEPKGETAKFDLTLALDDTQAGLEGAWEYNTDLFDATTIERMSNHFLTLLASIVADPDQSVETLQLVTEGEKEVLLHTWNATEMAYARNSCVHELFEAQAKSTPHAVALVFEDEQVTYQVLNRRANQLAHRLRELGVGPDKLVAICMDRSVEMVVALLAVLKAGGAYVPLDPNYPQERLTFVLEDAQVSAILTQRAMEKLVADQSVPTLYLDENWSNHKALPISTPRSGVTAANLAYVIYTSGSTGKPKGVQVPHAGVVNFLASMRQQPGITRQDTLLAVTTLSFDIAGLELYLPMLVGARLEVVSHDIAASGELLFDRLITSGATIMQATPTTWRLLLEAGWQASRAGASPAPTSPFKALCGGEALPRELANDLLDKGVSLWNLYGPTETTIWSATCNVVAAHKPISIGHPIANTQIYLLDAHQQPVPVGIPGELYIGGDGVTRGYLKRPELTAERFVPDPFGGPGGRLYRTGDQARYLPDGSIEFMGRLDHQVKVRGFRIELGEIETVLSKQPDVQECVVVVREDIPDQKRIVAYVVSRGDQALTVSSLRSDLKAYLPEYMIPSAFVFLNELPLTPNGKVDRRALPMPDTARPDVASTFAAPTNATEQLLADIWCEVLRLDRVGVNDNFFELGGDSIIGVQMIMKANEKGLRIAPRQLFQHQTIAELATAVGTQFTASAGDVSPTPAPTSELTGLVPLTPIQHWFFEQPLPDRHHWNLAKLLDVFLPDQLNAPTMNRGATGRESGVVDRNCKAYQHLDPALLRQCIRALMAHHDALRLRFDNDLHGWQQTCTAIAADEEIPLTLFDLTTVPELEQAARVEALANEVQKSLNIAKGPIIRVALFNLGEQQPNKLLIVIHHLAVDIVSWQVLLADLQTAYQQLVKGEPIQLPAKTTSFKDWAERLTAYAQSQQVQQELKYWLDRPWTSVRPLPVDNLAGINTEASARTLSASMSAEETRTLLQDVPKLYRTQVKDVLLTALAQSFAQWTGTSTLLVDLEGHGREDLWEELDLSRTVGWFTAIVPICLDLAGTTRPEEALKSVKEQLRAMPRGGIGFGILRHLSHNEEIKQRLAALPEAEVVFNYRGQSSQSLSENEGTWLKLAQATGGAARNLHVNRCYLLEVNGSVDDNCLHISLTYSENIHSRETIQQALTRYVEKLRAIIHACQSSGKEVFTPSDFPEAALDQQQLDSLMAKLNQL